MNKYRVNAVPIILDVEASGFGAQSYPIEVGVIKQNGDRYCSLIKPHKSWSHWDNEAQSLHGISRELLQKKGRDIGEICTELNQFLFNQTAYSDGWVVDNPWLIKLFCTARVNMEFNISPLEMILTEGQMDLWHLTKDNLETNLKLPRHRASNDAALIQYTYKITQDLSSTLVHQSVT